MINLVTTILALKANRRGVTALEYGLIAGLIIVTIAVGFTTLANALSLQFTTIASSL